MVTTLTLKKIPEKTSRYFPPNGTHQSRWRKCKPQYKKGENYQYQSEKPLKDGSYWVTATYKPTFWSQNNEGWKMDNLQGTPNAFYCEQTQMLVKLYSGG